MNTSDGHDVGGADDRVDILLVEGVDDRLHLLADSDYRCLLLGALLNGQGSLGRAAVAQSPHDSDDLTVGGAVWNERDVGVAAPNHSTCHALRVDAEAQVVQLRTADRGEVVCRADEVLVTVLLEQPKVHHDGLAAIGAGVESSPQSSSRVRL